MKFCILGEYSPDIASLEPDIHMHVGHHSHHVTPSKH